MIKGAGGGPRGPNLKIEFLSLLYAKEQELPASFYPIKKYCSYPKLWPVKVELAPVITVRAQISIEFPEKWTSIS